MTPDIGNPRLFSFFQLVHLIDRAAGGRPRLGYTGPPGDESLRLRPEASFGSQAAPVSALDTIQEDPVRYLLTVSVFGLYGADSPLPSFYTNRVLPEELDVPFEERQQNPVRDFLDIVNHRLLSLVYRAWLKYRLAAQYDIWNPDTSLPDYLFALLGLESADLRNALTLSARRLLPCAGLFTQKPHSADALRRIVAAYFHLPVQVHQCIGRWVDTNHEQRVTLGSGHATIGRGCVIGTALYIRDRYRVVLGPMTFERFIRFLPGQQELRELRELTTLFAPDGLECDVKLVMRKSGAQPCRLRGVQDPETPTKMGFTTWLVSGERSAQESAEEVSVLLSPYGEGLPS